MSVNMAKGFCFQLLWSQGKSFWLQGGRENTWRQNELAAVAQEATTKQKLKEQKRKKQQSQ